MNGFYYKRVLLKISGESLMGNQTYGIDTNMVLRVAEEIKGVSEQGIEVCLVIGGGKRKIIETRKRRNWYEVVHERPSGGRS